MDAKQKLRKRDRIVNAIAKEGDFRLALVKNSTSARMAQKRHGLSQSPAMFLARTMTASSMLASFLKGEERVIISLKGDLGIKNIYAEALQVGEVRGYVEFEDGWQDAPLASLGNGFLRVSRVIYGRFKPVVGVVELCKGDVSSDLNHYLNTSEQTPSAIMLDVDFGPDGVIRESAGLLLQAMPGAAPGKIENFTKIIKDKGSLTKTIARHDSPATSLREIIPFACDITGNSPLDFLCRCSLDHFKQMLLPMGIEELKEMETEGQNELTCQFCNKKYTLSEKDFHSMIDELKNKAHMGN